MFYFQKLEIYQLAKGIVLFCYQTTKTLPADERFGLTSQINRAAVSVPANIAEGTARRGKNDQQHFLNIAYASLMELICLFDVAQELDIWKAQKQRCLIKKPGILR